VNNSHEEATPLQLEETSNLTKAANEIDPKQVSSSEEEHSPDLVESSILTTGSRVLVSYKGQLYKATIRKRREKADTHDFLIHYDGNEKTTVHWVGSNRINKILETDVDTPPQKNNSMSPRRNKRSNCEKQRKRSRSDVVRYVDAVRQIHENEKSRDDNGVLKKKKRKVDGAVSSTVERQTTRSAPLSKYEKQWEEHFNRLREFKRKEGHWPLRDHELGKWVHLVSSNSC